MPNHVTNRLTFKGPKADVSALIEKARERAENDRRRGPKQVISFESFIPMTANVFRGNLGDTERAVHGEDNWYDWSIKHWGTKWDCYDTSLSRQNPHPGAKIDQASFKFDTAWSAPVPVIHTIAKMFPRLAFTHEWVDEDSHSSNHGREHYARGEADLSKPSMRWEGATHGDAEFLTLYEALKGPGYFNKCGCRAKGRVK